MLESINITTRARSELIDVTSQVQNVVASVGKSSGMCQVFVTHTTAGITINEKADPNLIPIQDGRLVLGTWQCIFFCEFDGPRTRSVVVNVI